METYKSLEQEFSKWVGLDPAGMVACSSGSAALHLAFETMQLPQSSTVLVPDFGMIACPRAVSQAGLIPTFVDCDERLNLDLSLTEDYLATKTTAHDSGAVLAVHNYGRRVDMDRLWRIRARQSPGWPVVEDLAEAHGIKPHPKTDAACWSFFKNKIVAGEEGGAVWFRNPEHANLARILRSQGFTDAHDFWHVPRGVNARLSNANAELILASLRNVDENLKRRREAETWYEEACPKEWRMPPRDMPWVYDVRIENLEWPKMGEIVKALNAKGIAARHSFKPNSHQKEYLLSAAIPPFDRLSYDASSEVFYLPIAPGFVTPDIVRLAFETIDRVLTR